MPKNAILSDLHANLPALEAVLREVEVSGAEEIVFGGDLVGYAAQPKECVDWVRRLGGRSVLGNHDAFTRFLTVNTTAILPDSWPENPVWAAIDLANRELDEEALQWLWQRPMQLSLDGGAVLAHASLHAQGDWPYLNDERIAGPTLDLLREQGLSIGFFGHTHQQDLFFDDDAEGVPEWIDANRVFIPENAVCAMTVGSVGQPRDGGDYRASWAIWDPEERVVEQRRTAYPAILAAQSILQAGLPIESALRLLSLDQRREWLGLKP